MNIRIIGITLIATLLFTAGCSGAWRRKFVRGKKDEVKQGPVLQPYDYKKEFTNKQLYANHYVFWKNSEAELINSVKAKGNMKKIKSRAAYSLVEIRKLANLLNDEKKAEIEPYVLELEDIVKKTGQPNYVKSNSNRIVSRLSKHYRAVRNRFSFFSMKHFVIKDDIDDTDDEQPEDAE
jgi:hypothetical protein